MALREQWESKAQQQGMQQGIKQGRLEEKQETAKNMMAQNLPDEVIARCTTLSKVMLEELKTKH